MYRTLITKDRLDEIIRLCKSVPKEGCISELGVYKGGSLKCLAENFPDRKIFGFDTFSGLPKEHWNESEVHKVGDFNDTSFESVQEYVSEHTNVKLIKGLFPDTAFEIKDKLFSFVHVDFDFYEGAKSSIEFFYPRLIKGGIMVFDDFEWIACKGVKVALDKSGLKYDKTNAEFQAYLIKQ